MHNRNNHTILNGQSVLVFERDKEAAQNLARAISGASGQAVGPVSKFIDIHASLVKECIDAVVLGVESAEDIRHIWGPVMRLEGERIPSIIWGDTDDLSLRTLFPHIAVISRSGPVSSAVEAIAGSIAAIAISRIDRDLADSNQDESEKALNAIPTGARHRSMVSLDLSADEIQAIDRGKSRSGSVITNYVSAYQKF